MNEAERMRWGLLAWQVILVLVCALVAQAMSSSAVWQVVLSAGLCVMMPNYAFNHIFFSKKRVRKPKLIFQGLWLAEWVKWVMTIGLLIAVIHWVRPPVLPFMMVFAILQFAGIFLVFGVFNERRKR